MRNSLSLLCIPPDSSLYLYLVTRFTALSMPVGVTLRTAKLHHPLKLTTVPLFFASTGCSDFMATLYEARRMESADDQDCPGC